ncbi:MAG TPA: alpha/beta fold hydrolase [Steroidobacteraceae bacterium]|nr:alpha/beta fold hydrolase [Steroidobacteraceae bacterium]
MSVRPPLPTSQRLQIPGPAGELELRVEVPGPAASAGAPAFGVPAPSPALGVPAPSPAFGVPAPSPAFGVICHPHPLFGGTLENKVVHTLARTLNELGMPTVRFNFRGVGASSGSHAEGAGETDDALAVIAWARARWPGAGLWLAGFSFGAAVALRACAAADPLRLIAVAPAVDRIDIGAPAPRCPWAMVLGDADEVVSPQAMLDFAGRVSPPPRLHVLAGAGHFFHGRLADLRAAVLAFAHEAVGAH